MVYVNSNFFLTLMVHVSITHLFITAFVNLIANSGNVSDTNVNSPWTQTCIAQADSILLVGVAEGSPDIGEYERFMLGMKSTARKILVLLHTERFSRSGLTRAWLRNRVWINGGHYHIQMAFRP